MKVSTFSAIVLCVAFSLISGFSQNHDSHYLNLKTLSIPHKNDNSLLFFCRKTNHKAEVNSSQTWEKSILLTSTNDTISLKARYFSEDNIIETLIGDDIYILFQEKVQAILIGNQVFIKADYPYKDQLYQAYFELIGEGDILLLKKENVYFIKKKNQSVQKLKPSKRGLSQISKSPSKEIQKYIREKKLSMKNEEDLKQLFFYINQELEKN